MEPVALHELIEGDPHEHAHPTKVRLAEEGVHAPLDLVDGAARVYDPIVRGMFLKDYPPSNW